MALLLYALWAISSAVWVGLALAPLPPDSPQWVLQTREVCFGTFNDGLPDTHGWISLAGPIPMGAALLALLGQDLLRDLRRYRGVLTSVLLALPFLTLGYLVMRVAQAPTLATASPAGPLSPDYPRTDEACPEFRLLDSGGRMVDEKQLKGRITLLTFAYGHCQTVCPGLIASLRSQVKPGGPRIVVVTLDPWRDACGSLRGLAEHWGLSEALVLTGVAPPSVPLKGETGRESDIEAVTRSFGVPTSRDPNTGDISHPALIFVLDEQARIAYRFTNPSSAWLQEAMARIQAKP